MAAGKKSAEDEPLNYGIFRNDDGQTRIAATPEEAVSLAFDGWRRDTDKNTAPDSVAAE